jgi:hypothetical protein
MDLDRTLEAMRLPPSCTPEKKAKKNASTTPDMVRTCSTRSPRKEAKSIEPRATRIEHAARRPEVLFFF